MQVQNNGSLDLAQALSQSSPAKQARLTAHQGCSHHDGDQVQLSDLVSQLAADPAKLSQLQAGVNSGTYQVSPSRVAAGVIADAINGSAGEPLHSGSAA